jgi:hypothetical protein
MTTPGSRGPSAQRAIIERMARAQARRGRRSYKRTKPLIISPKPTTARTGIDRSIMAQNSRSHGWTAADRGTVNTRRTG